MRGAGIETPVRYSWVKQPNGRYTIFDVPIFHTTIRRQNGKQYVLDEEWARDAIMKFQQDKERGKFPRAHIGHHKDKSTENLPGAGYVDFMRFQDGHIYADLVEIPEDVFLRMQKDEAFPHRSPEITDPYDSITSLALLESRSPYFDFPNMFLESSQSPLKFQSRRSNLTFQDDEEKKEKEEEVSTQENGALMAQDDNPAPQAPPQPQQPQAPDQTAQMLAQLTAAVNKIVEALGLNEEQQMQPQAPEPQQAAPVAMQGNDEILQFQKELYDTKREMRIRARAAEMDAAGLSGSAVLEHALKFSNEADAMLFMDTCESQQKLEAEHAEPHPASERAFKQYAQSAEMERSDTPETDMLAFQVYQDTLKNGTDREKAAILKVADNPKRFIERARWLESVAPGKFKRMYFSN